MSYRFENTVFENYLEKNVLSLFNKMMLDKYVTTKIGEYFNSFLTGKLNLIICTSQGKMQLYK